MVLAGVLIPGTALALPLYLLFSAMGLANTYWAVLIPSTVSPFGVYLCRIYAAAAVPDALLEAARIDGAGEARIFGGLGLRLMTPALVTVFLFQFVHIWNNYFLPLVMLSDSGLYPIKLGLTSWTGYADRQPVPLPVHGGRRVPVRGAADGADDGAPAVLAYGAHGGQREGVTGRRAASGGVRGGGAGAR